MADELTERAIQQHLWFDMNSRCRVILPNYTPRGWHECDLWAVTRAGYAHEYEIKLSVSDFRADARKVEGWRVRQEGDGWVSLPSRKKHERLARGDHKGPTRFWYVVPNGLLKRPWLPAWAGLIEAENSSHGHLILRRQRKAPRLHNQKVAQPVLDHALTACYYRFWTERLRADRLARDLHDAWAQVRGYAPALEDTP